MKTILLYIPVWQRRHITSVCYRGIFRIIREAPDDVRIVTLIVSSDEQDSALARQCNFEVMETENKPLGRKFNAGMEYALNEFEFDYVLQMNSDNLLSTDFWQAFTPFIERNAAFFGVDELYFYDSINTGQMRRFRYAIGCGIRFLRRDVVERAGFVETRRGKRFELWPVERNSGLDNASSEQIAVTTRTMQYFARSSMPLAVDIKSETNIHLFDEFRLAKKVDGGEKIRVLRKFPELGILENKMRK